MPEPPASSQPASSRGETRLSGENGALILGGILVSIVLPSVLTLQRVSYSVRPSWPADNPTPLGYTVSLLLYLTPIALLTTWFYRNHPRGNFKRRAFFLTLAILVPVGFLLDIIFGNIFFEFPNRDAVLQIYLPGLAYNPNVTVIWDLPLEEFVFYLSGFVAILLVYIWCSEYWVAAYGVDNYSDEDKHPPYVIQPRWGGLVVGAIAIAAAYAHKKWGPCTDVNPDPGVLAVCYRDGFPLYFTFLVACALVPALLLFRTAGPFINWRAFSITMLWVLLTSLLWEGTLASPFYWWHYEPEWMMNLPVRAWSDLPFEAVFLWIVVTFATTIVFETIKVALHLDKPLPILLFGPKLGSVFLRTGSQR